MNVISLVRGGRHIGDTNLRASLNTRFNDQPIRTTPKLLQATRFELNAELQATRSVGLPNSLGHSEMALKFSKDTLSYQVIS